MTDLSDQLRSIKGTADLLWALASSEGIHEKDMAEVLAVSLYRVHDEIEDILNNRDMVQKKGYGESSPYPFEKDYSATAADESMLSI